MARGGERKGAGRPVGSKSKATLAKEAAREVVRQAITKELLPIVNAAIKLAKGLSYLVTRDAKTGKFIRVTRGTLISTQTAIEVWEKEPDIGAIKELLDRAIDKPKETLEIENKTDWDAYRARIAETEAPRERDTEEVDALRDGDHEDAAHTRRPICGPSSQNGKLSRPALMNGTTGTPH